MATSKATTEQSTQRRYLRPVLIVIAIALTGLGIMAGSGGATWPDVLDAFGVSDGWFGVLASLGIIVSLPLLIFGGRVTARYGKIPMLLASGVGFLVVALGFMFAPRAFIVFAILMLIRGLSFAIIDLSANALAMDAERVARKHLMSPLHAGYSAGAVLGAGMTAVLFSAGYGFKSVYLIIIGVSLVIVMSPALVGFKDHLGQVGSGDGETVSLSGFRDPAIRLAAIVTGLSFAGEVLIAEWVAIYLRDVRGFSGSTGALAVTFYGIALMIGRLVNGPVVNRLGLRPSFQFQGILTIIGGVLIVVGGPAGVPLTGAFIAGFGLAGVGPSGLSLAGKAWPNAPGAASGLTLLGGYVGLAAAPLLGGIFASIASTRVTLACVAACGLGILLASFAVRADQNSGHGMVETV